MLKQFILLSALSLSTSVFAGKVSIDSLVLQPGPDDGKDAEISSYHQRPLLPNPPNFGGSPYFIAGVHEAVVRDGDLYNGDYHRSLIEFNLASVALPAGATFKSASLVLTFSPTHLWGGQVAYNGQTNAAWLKRITESWDEYQVTWRNQPAVQDENSILLPQSTALDQNYSVDISYWYTYFLANPSENHGFMLIPQGTGPFTNMVFGSSDAWEGTRPKLVIRYEIADAGPVSGKSIKFQLVDGLLEIGEPAKGTILDANG